MRQSHEHETDLDHRFATGDETELEEAIALYGQPLLRYCHNILCDYHHAQEVVQQVFLKAYGNRSRFVPGRSLSAWLYRIAYNTCVDWLRREKWRALLPIHDAGEIPVYDKYEEDDMFSQPMLEALSALTARERAIIYGRVVEGKSYSELEEILQVNQTALRKQYERAKKKLYTGLTGAQPAGREQNGTT